MGRMTQREINTGLFDECQRLRKEVANLQSRLAQAEEVAAKAIKQAFDEIERSSEQTKLEVAAALKSAAAVCEKECTERGQAQNEYDAGYDRGLEASAQLIIAIMPTDSTSLYERRMNEARLEEVEALHAKYWSKNVITHNCESTPNFWFCGRLAELRRATVGKGQGE
jgi:hypothetical protein